jgi:hypothetical protein
VHRGLTGGGRGQPFGGAGRRLACAVPGRCLTGAVRSRQRGRAADRRGTANLAPAAPASVRGATFTAYYDGVSTPGRPTAGTGATLPAYFTYGLAPTPSDGRVGYDSRLPPTHLSPYWPNRRRSTWHRGRPSLRGAPAPRPRHSRHAATPPFAALRLPRPPQPRPPRARRHALALDAVVQILDTLHLARDAPNRGMEALTPSASSWPDPRARRAGPGGTRRASRRP